MLRIISSLKSFVEPFSVGLEDVIIADIDGVAASGKGRERQLFFVQNGREESDRRNTIGLQVCHVSRQTGTVAQAGEDTFLRDTIGAIHHVHQVTQRPVYLVLMADLPVMEHTMPEVLVSRMGSEGPFIAIGHNENHRLATPFRYLFAQGIHRLTSFLP